MAVRAVLALTLATISALAVVAVTGCSNQQTGGRQSGNAQSGNGQAGNGQAGNGQAGNGQTAGIPTGTVHGTIVLVGGPPGAQPQPTAGTVTAERDGRRAGRQRVASGQRFSFALPAGTYTLAVTDADLRCADTTVAVRAATDRAVTLVCPIK
jgi:hypothetical protein